MTTSLEITGMSKVFMTPSGPYTAVKNVNAMIHAGEFVCILGHSGCGKSTVLSIIAGLQRATLGGVAIDGTEVDEPGNDRGVVFQSPSLLPWLSAGENVALAVLRVFPRYSRAQIREQVEKYMELVGVADSYDQKPAELSLGAQQCVSLARAMSIEPKFLLLDEPFSMLDSLTRLDLQDTLLEAWERSRKVVVMVTHDIDEALYLADRIILMTDGPEAHVGEIYEVPFARPRNRNAVLDDPNYFKAHSHVLDFLENHARQFTAA